MSVRPGLWHLAVAAVTAVTAWSLLAVPAVAHTDAVPPATAPGPGYFAGSASGPAGVSAAPATPGATQTDDALTGVSCALEAGQTNPFACQASGFYASFSTAQVMGYTWFWNGSLWDGSGPVAGVLHEVRVILLQGLSCTAPTSDQEACLVVGEHYSQPSAPVQLAEFGINGGMLPLTTRNPLGTTWSLMNGASCTSASFCMTVGTAGTSRRTTRGTVYYGHGTAYKWNGRTLSLLNVPHPARVSYSELTGISCADMTDCMAVGNYLTARGGWRTYAARWTSGTWHLYSTPNASGRTSTRFTSVSCPAPGQCLAAGDTTGPGMLAYAALFRAGTWHASATPSRAGTALTAISCPAAVACVAVGSRQGHTLAETWNGTTWTVQRTPALSGTRPDGRLLGVYCFTASRCFAVGYRYGSTVRYLRTLAEGWKGRSWQIQKSANF
ncbi:MAG TPA: hypothetical protein VF834_25295 [Streptosporangiaceae bacterium]